MLPVNVQLSIKEIVPCLRGWDGKQERPYRMAQLIVKERPKVVVEIGVFGGQTLIPMAFALRSLGEGVIFGIDPYDFAVVSEQLSEMDDRAMWLRQDMNVVRDDTLRWIRDLELTHHAILIVSESRYCSRLFDSIDILHIDGAHTEEGALLDVNLYAKRVRKGGHIWMDDTHFPSLKPALKELETFADLVDDWGGYRLYRHR